MKKLFLFLTGAVCCLLAKAQQDQATLLAGIQHIPAFKLIAVPDSSQFGNERLKKNQPVIVVFFNPDCEHCQRETKEFLAYKEEMKNIQVLMITTMAFDKIRDFYSEYNFASMPNVMVAEDENYALRLKYRPTNLPGIFVYTANGTLAKVFAGNVGVTTLLDAVK